MKKKITLDFFSKLIIAMMIFSLIGSAVAVVLEERQIKIMEMER